LSGIISTRFTPTEANVISTRSRYSNVICEVNYAGLVGARSHSCCDR
jgi:hypothetical protein